MTKRVLVVDDEPRFVRLVQANLLTEGFEVISGQNGNDAVQMTADEHPDLLLLDVMMPELDGFEACERIRAYSNIPIIMLTAKGQEEHRVRALDLGADDYIVKPFSANEMLARVRAVLRRAALSNEEPGQRSISLGILFIDLARAEVKKDGKLVSLSSTEYRLLLQFAQAAGKTLRSGDLLSKVWGPEYRDEKEILWVSISRLRQKLEEDPKNPRLIQTISGKGYTMPNSFASQQSVKEE